MFQIVNKGSMSQHISQIIFFKENCRSHLGYLANDSIAMDM